MINRKCNICEKSFPENKLISKHGIQLELESLIQNKFPDWTDENTGTANGYAGRNKAGSNKII